MSAGLAKIIERVVGLPSVQPTTIPVASKPGYIKVCLTFLTNEPKHYRSYQLAAMYGLCGPFTEEVCILIAQKSLTSLDLVAFASAFVFLQTHYVISRRSALVKATILDEDTTTLAYVCK